jgi:hypothetical protein
MLHTKWFFRMWMHSKLSMNALAILASGWWENHEQFKWTCYERQKISRMLRFYMHLMCNWEINFETITSQNTGWTTKVSWTHSRWHLWSHSTFVWTV